MTSPSLQETIDTIATEIVAPAAVHVDRTGAFPAAAVAALGKAGLLGLTSAEEVGGRGRGLRDAALVVERLARECGSTAMVVCMHYSAVAVIEPHGPAATRREIAAGRHLTTLAFSEVGSRGQFWAPVSTATADGDHVRLDARKSFVTSAGHADSYVWSSRPVAADGPSTLWLVPRQTPGVQIAGGFDGLGLRGNDSCAVAGEAVRVPADARLGDDGAGFTLMLEKVLPTFNVLSAAVSVGLMETATTRAAAHAGGTTFEHTRTAIADLPTVRAYIARMRIMTDMARALLGDTLDALERGRPDALLRVLESKAAAGEAAAEVTELAMRVCGGAAFRKDAGVERPFRDARAAQVMAPTTDVLYDFIGKAACGLPVF